MLLLAAFGFRNELLIDLVVAWHGSGPRSGMGMGTGTGMAMWIQGEMGRWLERNTAGERNV